MSVPSIIDKANAIIAEAQALSSGASAPSFPPAVNCLGGTVPAMPSFTAYDLWTDLKVRHNRMQGQLRNGWIPVIGTSITQSWDVAQIHPACVNLGIGSDRVAGVLNRLSSVTALNRAGAVILEIGANDAGYVQVPEIDAQVTALLGWLTGPLVVLSLVPSGLEYEPGLKYLSQSTMNAVNTMLAAKLAGRQKSVLVDITTPLKDTDGYMKASLSIGDRLHPNAAGYALLNPLVTAGLNQVLA